MTRNTTLVEIMIGRENYKISDRIMVVDKDIVIRNMMSMALIDISNVKEVPTAEKGLEVLSAEGSYNIILSSFALPGMNGLDFLRLVSDQFPETIRILMTGGCSDLISLNLAIIEGVINRVITKPFRIFELKEQLKNDLASSRRNNGTKMI